MNLFVCENVFMPLRAMPAHRSEMISEILFGERYTIIDEVPGWIKIELEFDGCKGWVDISHIIHSGASSSNNKYVLNRPLLCFRPDGSRMVIEPGSEIYEPDFNNLTFKAGINIYRAENNFSEKYLNAEGSLADTAIKFINSPYIWGGRVPSGIDCSGFTQLVFKIHGIRIPRNSWEQAEAGQTIEFLKDSKPGDLVFFNNERGKISHVGMILSEGLVIHASGRVKTDTIDHHGIFNHNTGKYSHQLRVIKRIIM